MIKEIYPLILTMYKIKSIVILVNHDQYAEP